jgi:MOSC domain-containing protein YiiM
MRTGRQGTLERVSGTVERIHVSGEHERLPQPVDAVEVTNEGVRGDRYFGAGDLTLIEAEALEAFRQDTGIVLTAAESRRQVLTRGIRLNDLVGRRFTVGEVECVGEVWCEPCNHLEGLTRPGVLPGMVHRAGLRADIVDGGRIAVGDEVLEGSAG